MNGALFLAVTVTIVGFLGVVAGGTTYDGASVSFGACVGVTIIGLLGCFFCLYEKKKKAQNIEKRPDAVIDAEYIKDKESMDEWYFREHGKMPEWPDKEEEKKENV